MFLSLTKFLHLTSLPKKRDHCDKIYTQPADVWGGGMPLSSIKEETALYNLFTLKTAYFLSCVKCCHQSWQRYLYFYFFSNFFERKLRWHCWSCWCDRIKHILCFFRFNPMTPGCLTLLEKARATTISLKPPVWTCKGRQWYFILREPWRAKFMPL